MKFSKLKIHVSRNNKHTEMSKTHSVFVGTTA